MSGQRWSDRIRPRAARGAVASLAAVAVCCAGLIGVSGGGCAPRPAAPAPLKPPTAVEGYVQGVLAYRAGDSGQAIDSLEGATARNPNLTMARSMLGDLYKDKGDYAKAAVQYKAVTKLDPYTAKSHYKLGVAYQLLNRVQDALRVYLRALKLDPRDWQTNMNLGLVYLALGRGNDAIAYTERATLLQPDSAAAFRNFGVALESKKRYREAELAYRRSLELGPDHPATLWNLSGALLSQKKGKDAVTVAGLLVKREDTPRNRIRYADALVQSKEHEPALVVYRAVLAKDPKNYRALNGIGAALIGQYERGLRLDDATRDAALGAWRKSLALNPKQPKVQATLKRWEP
jgi:tetratricopeptide (TPR) repeat protein